MNDNSSSEETGQLNRAVAEFYELHERGQTPDRSAMLDKYPSVAAELAKFFADYDRLDKISDGKLGPTNILPWRMDRSRTQPFIPRDPNKPGDVPVISGATQLPRIGPYELIAVVGRGGMGIVYKACHVELGRTVALKTILAGSLASPEDRQRFASEARMTAKLIHPGIVPLFDANAADVTPYLTMQLVEGESLATRLKLGPLTPIVAARMLRKITTAVAYAHGCNVIHRDLKPANILLAGEASEPRITDFGLAKLLDKGAKLTGSSGILGTPSYMPPEQASGREVGRAADIYALGAILYAMLTGRPPFQSENPVEVILQVLEREPILPSKLQPEACGDLEWICLKCLEKNPADRYVSAEALIEDLDRFLKHEPTEARSLTAGRWFRRWVRIQPMLAGHLIGIGATILVSQAVFALNTPCFIEYHLKISGLFLTWLLASWACQRLMDRPSCSRSALYIWIAADVTFFTAALLLQGSSAGVFVVGYVLLICVSGLAERTRLVTFTTSIALLAYLLLVLWTHKADPIADPIHCTFVALTLALAGLAVGYQVWRMSVLREYYGDQCH